ncbi:MAG TPA: DUF1572 family protein [Terriglobia bacterium]|nr:DUF1572 family protein [Terriglobia bacterium]
MRHFIGGIEGEFKRYKKLGNEAIRQVHDDAQLSAEGPGGGNSIAVLVWHLSGNLKSRFTEFLTSDGEKPWRKRDEEFIFRSVSRAELLAKWEEGWTVALQELQSLTDADLNQSVIIRGETFSVSDALLRSVAHAAYHAGQIVYLAKAFRGAAEFESLSIPLGMSEEFRKNPTRS